MNKMEANSPTSLADMLGVGMPFEVNGNTYTVCPIMAAHIDLFMNEKISLKTQMFNLSDDESKANVNKWLGEEIIAIIAGKEIKARYCFDKDGTPMSLEKAMIDGWNVVHFKNFFRKLCDISG